MVDEISLLIKEQRNLIIATAEKIIQGNPDNLQDDFQQVLKYHLASATTEYFIAKNGFLYIKNEKCKELEQSMLAFFIAESFGKFRAEISSRAYDLRMEDLFISKLYSEKIQRAVSLGLSQGTIDQIASAALSGDYGNKLYNSDEMTLQETFEKFSFEVILPKAENVHRENTLIPEEILNGLNDLGVFGINIPSKYGGVMDDYGKKGMMIITEELSRGSLALGGSMIVRPEILVTALLVGGTEEQKRTWLPKIASGDIINSIGVTEPDYGSDVANISLEANEISSKGEGYLLNGVKTWCTFAQYSDIILVLARSEKDRSLKHRGLTMFIAEKPRFKSSQFSYQQEGGGKISGSAIPTIGYRGMHSFEVLFENYFVPSKNMIGERGQGFYLQMAGFSQGRLQTAARVTGVMQAALDAAISYARSRKVFGKTIDQYEMTRWKIAKMSSSIQLIRQYVHALALEETKETRGRSIKENLPKTTFIKFYSAKVSEWITREAQQIHGGMGYAEEYPVSRYFLDARVFSIFEGVEEVLALKVCSRALMKSALNGSLHEKL